MAALATDLRNRLENTVKKAREEAERGARHALEALAVDRREAHASMGAEEKALRNRLRAHGRQLGDLRTPAGTRAIDRLVREVAYEHWHRMLFARFLAENDLLIHPDVGVALTMQECEELARERGEDPWALAASFAQTMLPQIFRVGDPALEISLPPETRQKLQRLLAEHPSSVFTEDDSLGWTYQFWQAAEKDAVNARAKAGEKITGETLPAVTQLFTEPYMVQFLLHNTIGAWHAGRTLSADDRARAESEEELRSAVRLAAADGYDFSYLRFVRDGEEEDGETGPWRPAAGTFDRWPDVTRELTVLDPCCGSGHFLVAAFDLLARLRMQEEGISRAEAARAVIGENLFGLELDARCTQIAAFNLALAAWKFVGRHVELPPMRIACSGIGPQASKQEWLALAEEAARAGGGPGKEDLFESESTFLSSSVRGGLDALYNLFQKAPDLGSLIDPRSVGGGEQTDALVADLSGIEPVLDAIIEREEASSDDIERAVAAKGMAEALRILRGAHGDYHLIITNVPYLKRGSLSRPILSHIDQCYKKASSNLASVMVQRWLPTPGSRSVLASVTNDSLLFRKGYTEFRRDILTSRRWPLALRLGTGAFGAISGEVVSVALIVISGEEFCEDSFVGMVAVGDEQDGMGSRLAAGAVGSIPVPALLDSPASRIAEVAAPEGTRLADFADALHGQGVGNRTEFYRMHWEVEDFGSAWEPYQLAPRSTTPFGGRTEIILWEGGAGKMKNLAYSVRHLNHKAQQWRSGKPNWDACGVIVSLVGERRATLYSGNIYGENCCVIVPYDETHLEPIWRFASSKMLGEELAKVDPGFAVSVKTVLDIPFDPEEWKAGSEFIPNPDKPHSNDPTQWLFHGHPAHAERGTELHVGVARLLGYRWPAESDPEMRLSEEARELIDRSKELDAKGLSDEDGIVCLSPVRGEGSAALRLRELMAAAYGSEWSSTSERELLERTAAADNGKGNPARSLDEWLRKRFFEEHCRLFHHRPFVWHVWDGLPHGFNALVNYHELAGPDGEGRRTLESLTYTYLGEWIERQRAAQQSGKEGADARLAAAQRLQRELERILEGEPPYDVFVRWKPLHEQPLGWEPDRDDGVLLNIRPFLKAEDVGRSGAGILRWKPNCKWTPDRGKEPESLRSREEFPWFWGCDPKAKSEHRIDFGADTRQATPASEAFDGRRWNDLHYTRAAKEAARKRAASEPGG